MRTALIAFIFLFILLLGGCVDSFTEGSADPVSSGLPYYYDEFSDVSIPKEMQPETKETFITYASDGLKHGTQTVTGRVEMSSLVAAMMSHMRRDGWALRSVFRSSRSILIFERPEKLCSIYISEGLLYTTMVIFVSPKVADGVSQYSVPVSTAAVPVSPAAPPLSSAGGTPSSGRITVYPAK